MMLTPNEPDEAQLAGVDVRQQPQLLQNPAAAASSPKLSTGSALTTQTSRQWSSHSCLADHKEIQATAMAVDSRGEVAVLGARKMLAVVPIRRENRNLEIQQKFYRNINSKWDITKLLWNPDESSNTRAAILAAATHDRVELFDVGKGELNRMSQLKSHSMVITDLDWDPNRTELLASASIDGFVNIWDYQDSRSPLAYLNCMVPCSQVSWHRFRENLLSTCLSNGDVQIWDLRNPSLPTAYVTAHPGSNILSFDWSNNPATPNQFVTSGQDCTVKFFELGGTGKPTKILKTAVPVWRARHAPFGDGLATVIVPQLNRNDNSLFLWNSGHLDSPVHCFFGHMDVILDFDWKKEEGSKDFELITWSRDRTLRLWSVDSKIQSQCETLSTGDDSEDSSAHSNDSISQDDLKHCEHLAEVISIKEEATQSLPDITSPEEVTLTRASGLNLLLYNQADQPVLKVAEVDPDEPMMEGEDDPITIHASSSRNLETQPQQQLQRSREATPSKPAAALLLRALPDPLQQEFELLNTDGLAQIKVEELDLIKRNCKVSASILAKQTMKRLYLRVTFPTEYPDNVPPHFNIGKGTTLASGERHSILKAMKSIAKQQVKRNRTCLEACLRQLELLVDQIQKSGSVLLLQKDSSQTSTPPPFPLAGATAPQDILDGALGNFSDSNIPYPRTCGARFSGNGHLVCFGRSSKSKVLQSSSSGGIPVTPRAYSAFGAHLQMVQQMDAFQGQHKILQSPGNTYGTIRSSQGSSSQNLSQMGSAGDSSSLKRKGRFNVRRVRSGSSDEGKTAPLALRKISTSSAVGPALQESGSVGNSNRSGTQDQLDTMGNAAREGRRGSSVVHFCMVESQIVIYDVSKMFLFDKELAAAYVLRQDDAIGVCQDNSSIAARLGKPERAYLWQVCAQIASNVKTLKKTEIPWSKHPMGRPMLMSILNHLVSNHDVQMAAMLTCIFRPKQVVPPIRPTYNIPTLRYNNSSPNKIMNSPTSPKTNPTPSNSPKNSSSSRSSSAEKKAKFWFLKPGALPNISDGSPYHTFSSSSVVSSKKRSVEKNHSKHNHLRTITAAMSSLGSDSNLEQFVTPYYKASRSNSWSDPFEEISPISEEAREEDAFATALLDPERQDLYDGLKQAYANILFNWGMLMKRTTVLKAITKQPQKHYGLDMASDCPSCGEKQITGVQCKTAACRAIVMKCAVCRLSVRGLASWCDKCGHGGHFQHWAEWFGAKWGKQKCPTGCGCRCQEEQLLSSQSQESIEPQF